MKIELNEKESAQLEKLLSQRDENIQAGELWNSFLEDHYDALNGKGIRELMEVEGLSENEAVEEGLYNYLSLDSSDPYLQELRKNTGFGVLSPLDEKAFLEEPFNHLRITQAVLGPYQLTYNYFAPYELFNDQNTVSDEKNNYAEKTHVSYFRKKVPYLLLKQKDEVWMSITPHEVYTMKKAIADAKGDVLTLGLGLGYYAYMVTEKKEVASLTVIEKDSKVIQLFKKNILPLFGHPEKVHIIHMDAFLFFERELKEKSFDSVFVDLYHTPDDALGMYLRLKSDERKYGYRPSSYWIEESILCLLRRYVLTLVEEYYQGMTLKDYETYEDEQGKILLSLYKAMEEKEFTSYASLYSFLSDDSLKQLAGETDYR